MARTMHITLVSDSLQPHTQGKMTTSALQMEIWGGLRRYKSSDHITVSSVLPQEWCFFLSWPQMPIDSPEKGDACDVGLVQRGDSVLGSSLGCASSYQSVDFSLPKWPAEHPW